MDVSKKDVKEALERLAEGKFGDPYGSDRAVERCTFDALVERVDELEKIVRYLARRALQQNPR